MYKEYMLKWDDVCKMSLIFIKNVQLLKLQWIYVV